MARSLKSLIDAGASAPWSAGESFLNQVNQAFAATKMTDYIISSMDFSGEVPAPELTYNSGEVFNEVVGFTEGPKARYIRRLGNVIAISPIVGDPGQAVTGVSNVVQDPTASTLDVTVIAPVNAGTINQYAWFKNFTSPNMPASSVDPAVVRFTHQMTGGGASGTKIVSWNVNYSPDLAPTPGPFNPFMSTTQSAKMNRRADSLTEWEYEWHGNSTYTNLLSGGMIYDANSSPQQSSTYWSRIRRPGGSWVELGGYTFVDPRPLV